MRISLKVILKCSLLKPWCGSHREHRFQCFLYCCMLISCLFTILFSCNFCIDSTAPCIFVSVYDGATHVYVVSVDDGATHVYGAIAGNDCLYLFHCSGFQLSCHIILAALNKTRSACKYSLHLLEFWNSGRHNYKTGSDTEPPLLGNRK
jgi:hypothetical protein